MSPSLHITPSIVQSAYASCIQITIGLVRPCLHIICQMSITFFYHMILLYYALSSFLSRYVICPYVYSLLDPWFSHDPLSLCSCWFIRAHDPLHFQTNPPIIVSLLFILLKWSMLWSRFTSPTPDKLLWPSPHSLMPLFLYCCAIYRSHICGVLSWPHFCV